MGEIKKTEDFFAKYLTPPQMAAFFDDVFDGLSLTLPQNNKLKWQEKMKIICAHSYTPAEVAMIRQKMWQHAKKSFAKSKQK